MVFYVSKPDAYDDNGRLVKLGRERVRLEPNPFVSGETFEQTIKLRQSEIVVKGDTQVMLKVWVDANEQVIHIEYDGNDERLMQVHFETWREIEYTVKHTTISDLYNTNLDAIATPDEENRYRTISYPDVVIPDRKDRIVWYHHNRKSGWPLTMRHHGLGDFKDNMTDPLLGRAFGGAIKGEGFAKISERAIQSDKGRRRHAKVFVLCQHPTTIDRWLNTLDKTIERVDKLLLKDAYKSHLGWWDDFWMRSWVHIGGAQGIMISYRHILICM